MSLVELSDLNDRLGRIYKSIAEITTSIKQLEKQLKTIDDRLQYLEIARLKNIQDNI